jgi:hypothetical protein
MGEDCKQAACAVIEHCSPRVGTRTICPASFRVSGKWSAVAAGWLTLPVAVPIIAAVCSLGTQLLYSSGDVMGS